MSKGKEFSQRAYRKPISSEKYFYMKDGRVIKNIAELYEALKKIDERTFSSHVNEKKNDFAKWVEEVFEERELANALARCKRPMSIRRAIYKHMK